MRVLASSGHSRQDGRNWLDDTKNSVPKAQRRSCKRIRQAQIRNASGSTNW